MEINGALIKQRLREGRWHWWAPAAFFVGICLLPSGTIEASPGEIFRPPVLYSPMAWPLFAMGFVFGAAAFSLRLRRRAWHILFLGTVASLLFELILVAVFGAPALYSWELGTNLQNRIFTDFEPVVLAFGILPMDLVLVALSAMVLWVRDGKPGPEEPVLYFPVAPPSSPNEGAADRGQRAEIPELPVEPATGADARPGGAAAAEKPPETAGEAGLGAPVPPPPSVPASPLDAITGMAPEAKPEMTAEAPAGPEPAPPAAAPGSPPETAPPDGGFTP
jgi:hypothetical protein